MLAWRCQSEECCSALLELMTTPMGLDCLPVHCRCGKHRRRKNVPEGLTHPPDATCPFEADDFPLGVFAGCCGFRGKGAAGELEALGETDLAEGMYRDMTHEEAAHFATELEAAADRLEQTHAADAEKPKGAGWNLIYDKKQGTWVTTKFSTFDEALTAIRQAASWYRKVADLGFGVHAWY